MKKFFISVDMEGITGTVSWLEYERENLRFRKIITEEVLAAIRGIEKEMGEGVQIVICDAHGSGLNILFEELPSNVSLVRGSPKDLGMMAGIDEGFLGVLFLGYHSPIGTAKALMEHTYASLTLYEIKINDKPVSEAIINAAIAGYFDVPVIFVSGDDKLVAHIKENFDREVETVITKYALSRFSAITKTPKATLKEIFEKVAKAVKKCHKIKSYKLNGPLSLEFVLNDTLQADLISLIPGVKRKGGRVIQVKVSDIIQAQKIIRLIAVLGHAAKEFFR